MSQKRQKTDDKNDDDVQELVNTVDIIKLQEFELILNNNPCVLDYIQICNTLHNLFDGKTLRLDDISNQLIKKLLTWIKFVFDIRSVKNVKFCTTIHIANSLSENLRIKSINHQIKESNNAYEQIIMSITEINTLPEDHCEGVLSALIDSMHDKLHTLSVMKEDVDINQTLYLMSLLLTKCLLNISIIHKPCIVTHIIMIMMLLL